MTQPIASLPMYDWPEIHDETEALWTAIAARFHEAGIDAPDNLNAGEVGVSHWLNPDLLLSQTCGYPFATKLMGNVELLGTPVYAVQGCYGSNYSSAIVVRADDEAIALGDTASHRFAYNGPDSLSGYRCLVPLIGGPLQFFGEHVLSGGHRASATMISEGEADIAAIDAVCWHVLQQVEPETARRLRVLLWGPLFPALPFITRKDRDSGQVAAMREALIGAVRDNRDALPVLQLSAVERVGPDAYAPLAAL